MSAYRVFRTRIFTRWMRRSGVADDALRQAVAEMAAGLIDARLGGLLVKKRIPIPGRGKRAGARTIVATKLFDRWFFVFGFGKNEQEDIDPEELKALQRIAGELLEADDQELAIALETGKVTEISNVET